MRDGLIAAILAFLPYEDKATLDDIRASLEREIDEAGPEALEKFEERLTADLGWDYYPRDPLAHRIHHLLAGRFLTKDSQVLGTDSLPVVENAPVVIFSNHLSYADANVVEVLLQRCGGSALANRMTAIAGPKIFTSKQRRFSSLCFGTIKVPQSTEVSSDEAVLGPREVARAARRSIEVAHERLAARDALLLFGEGTRSRTASMQPMLPAVARYLGVPGAWVLPVGLAGPEALFPIDSPTIQPARVVMRIGSPIPADVLLSGAQRDRRLLMDAIGLAIAELLPPDYRGVYAKPDEFPQAHDLLQRSRLGASA